LPGLPIKAFPVLFFCFHSVTLLKAAVFGGVILKNWQTQQTRLPVGVVFRYEEATAGKKETASGELQSSMGRQQQ
jgi:hypothetical protein